MDELDPNTIAADALRKAAAELIAKAEQLESLPSVVESAGSAPEAPELEPLSPPDSSDEAGARLVALDMSSRGVPREEAAEKLALDFPSVDADALLDRFYRS